MQFPFFRHFFCLVLLVIFTGVHVRISSAHVDADSMPDSVAEVEYRIFLEFRPNDAMIRNKLGMVLYRRNKFEEAAREFLRVLKLDPDNFDALDSMGLVKAAQQQYDQAIGYHRAALALHADDVLINYHLGAALEKKGLFTEAVKAYRTALDRIEATPGTVGKQAAQLRAMIQAAIANIRKIHLPNEVAQ